MTKQYASIFNDVIGPIMRGASSSHVAASVRIGKLVRQMIKGNIKEVIVDFDRKGSLATTYHGHGSDMGLVAGLLNFEPDDDRLPNSLKIAKEEGIKVSFNVIDYEASHPNTYKITLISDIGEIAKSTSISTGGGMINFLDINEYKVSIDGGYYETLIFTDNKINIEDIIKKHNLLVEDIKVIESDKGYLINIKSLELLDECIVNEIGGQVMILTPVLPIMSSNNVVLPFVTLDEMLKIDKPLWELAVDYESARGNISKEEVMNKMKEIVLLIKNGIKIGLEGTEYKDRILGRQSHKIGKYNDKLLPSSVMNRMIAYVTALMEVKSSMNVFVAAPTAGSCGGLPGTILALVDELELSDEEATRAMLSAGIIGVFIAEQATFAAEVAGCQAECGAGSSMAAAGLVELMNGSAKEATDAASMALQNLLGMVCDPVADRVESPCLGKNVLAGSNALSCANMALAGFDKVIPLNETIDAMYEVGKMLPSELRCTGNGGLSITNTAKKIYINLNK